MTTTLVTVNGHEFVIDTADLERVSSLRWGYYCQGENWYIKSTIKNTKAIFLHRFIMEAKKGQVVDHIDRNTKNNSRANLRLCTNSQNTMNKRPKKPGYVGIEYNAKNGKWRGKVAVNRKRYSTSFIYTTKEDAARARDALAIKYHGEFPQLNFPNDARNK